MTASIDGSLILVVDDMEASRTIMPQTLTLHGYQVDMADGSVNALKLAREHTYQLAILD